MLVTQLVSFCVYRRQPRDCLHSVLKHVCFILVYIDRFRLKQRVSSEKQHDLYQYYNLGTLNMVDLTPTKTLIEKITVIEQYQGRNSKVYNVYMWCQMSKTGPYCVTGELVPLGVQLGV